MKNIFLFLGMLFFQNCNSQPNSNTKKETCLNQANFDKAYDYILWKYQTAKRLSKNKKVMFGNGYELAAIEQDNIGKRIIFSKDGYKGFSVDMKEGFIPHTKVSDLAKYEDVFCELIQQASFHYGVNQNLITFNFEHPNARPLANLLNKYKERFIQLDIKWAKDKYQHLILSRVALEGKESKMRLTLTFFKEYAGMQQYFQTVFAPQKDQINLQQNDGSIWSVASNGSVIFEVTGTDKWRVYDLISYLAGEE